MAAAGLLTGASISFCFKDQLVAEACSKTLLSLIAGSNRASAEDPQAGASAPFGYLRISGSSRPTENWLPISCLGERTRAERQEDS